MAAAPHQIGEPRGLLAASAPTLWDPVTLALLLLAISLYRWLDLRLLRQLFVGDSVSLVYHPDSHVAKAVLPHCSELYKKIWLTPWLCSPHFQTAFLHFAVHAPSIDYRRELLKTPDGGTLALDWADPPAGGKEGLHAGSDRTPVVVLVPGLTSDSQSGYILQTVKGLLQLGWQVLVTNHRGLGGVSLTSDTFYNAGWTEDLRCIINHVRELKPNGAVVAVGTSLGANILVKYLGEEGSNTPLLAAATVGNPWDLLVCDRWMHRKHLQKFYNAALAIGLKGFANLHKDIFSRIANWDYLFQSQTIREFDDRITRICGNFETVDTYYRKSSCAPYVSGVGIPLLCISALDDPICTKEAIPWDECRANPNVILVTTQAGGHLAYLEGITAHTMWWMSPMFKFLAATLAASPPLKNQQASQHEGKSMQSSFDRAPFMVLSSSAMAAAPVADIDNMDSKERLGNPLQTPNGDGNMMGSPTEQVQENEEQKRLVAEVHEISMTLSFKSANDIWLLKQIFTHLLEQMQKAMPDDAAANTQMLAISGASSNDTSAVVTSTSAIAAAAASVATSAATILSMLHKETDSGNAPGREKLEETLQQQVSVAEGTRLEMLNESVRGGLWGTTSSRQRWLLGYGALAITFPVVGFALLFHRRKRVLGGI
eukprot:SM000013S26432  [mRNA]  locus=s13:381294:386850:- [translate_table: standard]